MSEEKLCIFGLFSISICSLFGAIWTDGSVQTILATISSSVVGGILGYLKGKN